jgi:hypothetical protein
VTGTDILKLGLEVSDRIRFRTLFLARSSLFVIPHFPIFTGLSAPRPRLRRPPPRSPRYVGFSRNSLEAWPSPSLPPSSLPPSLTLPPPYYPPSPPQPAPWSPPKLDPNTPSPIFGGSTGGLLRKAQVGTRDTSFFRPPPLGNTVRAAAAAGRRADRPQPPRALPRGPPRPPVP